MSKRRRGQRWFCACVTCDSMRSGALDYRNDRHKKFKPHPCPLCLAMRPDDQISWVIKPLFIPDSLREFLGMEYICACCVASIDNRMQWNLRACWASASEVLILATMMTIYWFFKTEYLAQIRIIKAMREGSNIPDWAKRIERVRATWAY